MICIDRASATKRLGNVLKSNLDDCVDDLHADWDVFIIIIGKVGVGKSTLAHLLCFYVDTTYNIKRVIFTKEQYDKVKVRLKKYQSMQIDELINLFFSQDAATAETRATVKEFHKLRKKNFFIVGCVDDIFSLTRWISRERPTAVLRITRRGVVEGYNFDQAKKIRIDSKKNVIFPEPNFIDWFRPIPKKDSFWKEYKKMSDKYSLKGKEENPKVIKMRKKMEKKLKDSLTVREMAEIQHVNRGTIHRWIVERRFPKKDVFIDPSGRRRVTIKGFQKGIKRLEKERERKKLLSMLKKKPKRRKRRKRGV